VANDPRRAHREEILEGLIEAARKGDEETFSIFNQEWERLREGQEDTISFNGMPQFYMTSGFCHHCNKVWVMEGIAFGEMMPGLSMAMHMNLQCGASDDCRCWSEIHNDSHETMFCHPNCQECWHPAPGCTCDEEPSLGPCASIELYERIHGVHEIGE